MHLEAFRDPITETAQDSAWLGFVISKISDVFSTYQTNVLLGPRLTSEKAFELNYLA